MAFLTKSTAGYLRSIFVSVLLTCAWQSSAPAQEITSESETITSPPPEPRTSARWHYSRKSIEKHQERGRPQQLTLPAATKFHETSGSIIPDTTETDSSERNNYLGVVVWVDSTHNTAVGYLESRFLKIENTLVTRNQALEVTSTLRPTPVQRGRAFGFEILSGFPNRGDEIIHPGSSEQ